MTKTLPIIGRNIQDIPSFYAEINRVFMANEEWALGESLDAMDDLLYGGYGAIAGGEPIYLIWQDIEISRAALGVATTRAFLTDKLHRPDTFNAEAIERQLQALERGTGKTYFEIVLEIIGTHRNITLVTT